MPDHTDHQKETLRSARKLAAPVFSDLLNVDLVERAGVETAESIRKVLEAQRAERIKEAIDRATGQDHGLPDEPPAVPSSPHVPYQLGPYAREPIHFPGDVPVKVYENKLTLYRDGSYHFRGRFYNAGAGSYDTAIAWVIFGASGQGYSFSHAGHLGWGPEENDPWDAAGKKPELVAAFADMANGDRIGHCQAAVDFDVVALVGVIVKTIHPAAPIVEMLR